MNYSRRVSKAVKHFWKVRTRQHENQGAASGRKDAGYRSAVTGGKHLDGFINLFSDLLAEAGLPDSSIHTQTTTLPGYFRPAKKWDLVVVADGALLASIEFKAQVGPSFGNNFNNRVEEALGNSSDILTAYREGKFPLSQKPWLGWMMLLEETPRSSAPVRIDEPHFDVFQSSAKHPTWTVTGYSVSDLCENTFTVLHVSCYPIRKPAWRVSFGNRTRRQTSPLSRIRWWVMRPPSRGAGILPDQRGPLHKRQRLRLQSLELSIPVSELPRPGLTPGPPSPTALVA